MLTANGQPHLLHQDASGALQLSRLRPDESWVTTEVPATNVLELVFGLDDDDRPVVLAASYADSEGRTPDMRLVSLVKGESRWATSTVASESDVSALDARIYFDASGHPRSVYSAPTGEIDDQGIGIYGTYLLKGDGQVPHEVVYRHVARETELSLEPVGSELD